ncbi:MAG: hypothetical protein HFP81_01640 [Methylococcales symbiont of Hymedesmia sp. n. MRB-2018]|nr:MAG: hypothetical protein HFP78_03960 [Methylococcales symbiont of Hymedesmia sp. n. MRB-2018]KAF3984536.1 MAG: hypothetical protein HFP81_01640 [Methylococcales symbiont of Hymedesmia sp. n. MRB-2018]
MNLQQYLNQIRAGKAINFSRFISLLPELYKTQKRERFDVTLQAPQKWLVNCSLDLLQELETLAEHPTNRLQAADRGDSHRFAVSVGFLLVYHHALADMRPDVVYLEQDSYLQNFQAKKRLLIVENEENFFLPELMLKLATKFTKQQIDSTNTDIALGSGVRVTSRLARSWYQQYDHILCAFDYDATGLKMYRTLKTNLGDHIQFLQPHSYSEYQQCFKMKPKTQRQLMECIKLAEQLGFVALAATVQKHKKFMEQEMLLLEMDDD